MLELCSSIQIPFCQIRLRSITCHFPVKNLHLITYSNRIGINKTYWGHCLKNFDLSLQDGLSSLFFFSHLKKIDLEPNKFSIISVLIKQDCAPPRSHPIWLEKPVFGSNTTLMRVWVCVCVYVFMFMYTCMKSKTALQAKLKLLFSKGYLQYTKSSI